MKTPRIEIDLGKLAHNAAKLTELYGSKGISVTGVTKGVCGNPTMARIFLENGAGSIGESRLANIARMRDAGIEARFMLLRLPAVSETSDVVSLADVSLNTEVETIRALSAEAKKRGVVHGIILMVELGDLREGIMPAELEPVLTDIRALDGVRVLGLGANLSCLGGVLPDDRNMGELSGLAARCETILGHELEFVSIGNSQVYLWLEATAEVGKINHARLGESILLGGKDLDCKGIPGLHCDVFTVVAEVIESKVKPSLPYGEVSVDAFGNIPEFEDKGDIRRAILGLGRQDVLIQGLFPAPDIEVLGASGDHLIVDAKKTDLRLGDEVRFDVDYAGMISAMTSPYVAKVFVNE